MPGRPNTGLPASEPNVIGLPGRMSTFHRCRSAPALTSASRTRSSSPTETPADDTSMSASVPRAMRSAIASSRSGATPRLSGRPPASTICAISEYVLAFGICAAVGSVPRSASSLPVESTATRGRRPTVTCVRPSVARIPISAAPIGRPGSSTRSPSRTSSPAGRTKAPGTTVPRSAITPSRASTSSCGTTASAPSGSGAPVKMRTASPAPTARVGRLPAMTRSTTRSVADGRASAARTA